MVWFMVFNATFNNILVISWRSVLLVEETGVSGENHRPSASHSQTLSHNVVSSTPRHERDSKSQRYLWYTLITKVVVNPTTIQSRPRRPHNNKMIKIQIRHRKKIQGLIVILNDDW